MLNVPERRVTIEDQRPGTHYVQVSQSFKGDVLTGSWLPAIFWTVGTGNHPVKSPSMVFQGVS